MIHLIMDSAVFLNCQTTGGNQLVQLEEILQVIMIIVIIILFSTFSTPETPAEIYHHDCHQPGLESMVEVSLATGVLHDC